MSVSEQTLRNLLMVHRADVQRMQSMRHDMTSLTTRLEYFRKEHDRLIDTLRETITEHKAAVHNLDVLRQQLTAAEAEKAAVLQHQQRVSQHLMPDETPAQAIARIMTRLAQTEVERSRAAAVEEQKRMQVEASTGPRCTSDSVDLISGDQLRIGEQPEDGGELITLAPDAPDTDLLQCYIRDQLKQTVDNASTLYEFRMDDRDDPFNHVSAPLQRIYKIPPGFMITEDGYRILMDARFRNYRLIRVPGTHNISADDHTVGAIWNRTDFPLYNVINI